MWTSGLRTGTGQVVDRVSDNMRTRGRPTAPEPVVEAVVEETKASAAAVKVSPKLGFQQWWWIVYRQFTPLPPLPCPQDILSAPL